MTIAPAGEGVVATPSPVTASTPATPTSGGGSEAPAASSPSSSAGASPSPASPAGTPSSQPVAPTPPGAAPIDEGDFFSGLGGDDLEVDDFSPTPAAVVPPTPAAQPVPPTPPASPAQVAPPTPGTPTAAPAAGPQEAGATPAPTPQIPTPAEPDKIASLMQNDSVALIDHLAATTFKLSPEDIEALETDAPAFIPKLLARVFFQSQVNMMQQMSKVIPAMVQRIGKVTESNSKNEGKFYARWPDLKADVHGEIVRRLATTYRQMNPSVSLDQMVEDLGPIVMMAAKVVPGMHAASTNGAAGAPASARPNPPPSPFKPAVGGAAIPPQPGAEENPWMGLAAPIEDE